MRISIFFFLCVFPIFIFSQTEGNNPMSIEWKVLNTPAANIIYPAEMDVRAQRIANLVNYLNENSRRSIGENERKIDILVQNQTVIPNGYVSLAPFRSEFYATPPASVNFLGTIDWLDVLTIHEYRHGLQFMNLDRGLGKLAYVLFGDQGLLISSVLAVPNWYFEGDAVIAETAQTKAGRGRTPDFTKGQRALAAAGIDYSYIKSRNGSLKDFVPNHYPLGYMMLTELRNEYGNDVSGEIVREGASFKKIIYPYSRSMKKKVGLHTHQLYQQAWSKNKQRWTADQSTLQTTATTRISQENSKVTNYYYPQFIGDSKIASIKRTLSKTSSLVEIDQNGEEVHLVDMGINLDQYFDHRNGSYVWTEFSTGGRRSNVSYSDVVLFRNGKRQFITKDSKCFSPVFMDDNHVLVVFIDPSQQASLLKLDINTGNSVLQVDMNSTEFITRPAILGENEVAYIVKRNNQLYIEKINLETQKRKILLGPTYHVIDDLEYENGELFFTASFSGIDNIYSLNLDSGDIHQLTSTLIAAGQPAVSKNGKELIFTQFDHLGHYITKGKASGKSFDKSALKEPNQMQWQDKVAAKAEGGDILGKVPTEVYASKNYKGLMRGMRFHSWGLGGSTVTPSLRIQANNVLDDASLAAIVGYNTNEQQLATKLNLRIAKFFPVFDFELGQNGRSVFEMVGFESKRIQFNEAKAGIDVSIPYAKLKGNYSTRAKVNSGLTYNYQYGFEGEVLPGLENRGLTIGSTGVEYSYKRRIASQNLRSRFGVDFKLRYQYQLTTVLPTQFNGVGGLYLPGLAQNHSLYCSGGIRLLGTSEVYIPFINDFQYVRGFVSSSSTAYKLSVDYALPLFYPDVGLRGIVYTQRIKMNVFADYGIESQMTLNRRRSMSFGVELVSDNIFLNLLPFPLGIQVGYGVQDGPLTGEGSMFFNFVTNTNF